MDLEDGMYAASPNKRVTVWKAPSHDGDGEEVWRDLTGPNGEQMGRERVKDDQNRPVFNWEAPEGFRNFPSFDHTDNYIRVKGNGRPHRTPAGETVGIKPGTVLVEYPDGKSELLEDEYSQYLFAQAHESTGGTREETPADKVAADKDNQETRDAKRADLQKQLAALDKESGDDV